MKKLLKFLGESGYLELTRKMLAARDGMLAAVRATPGITPLVEPEAQIVCITGTIGTWPALIALFLYALLPIVLNTCAGLTGIVRGMRQAAMALGLEPRDRLWLVEVPLAQPSCSTRARV